MGMVRYKLERVDIDVGLVHLVRQHRQVLFASKLENFADVVCGEALPRGIPWVDDADCLRSPRANRASRGRTVQKRGGQQECQSWENSSNRGKTVSIVGIVSEHHIGGSNTITLTSTSLFLTAARRSSTDSVHPCVPLKRQRTRQHRWMAKPATPKCVA